jgi:hypothetical protein
VHRSAKSYALHRVRETKELSMPHPPRFDERWIRHDWQRWIRPDIARWMKPGVDPADVIPALARERARKQAAIERARAAEDAELAAEIEDWRRTQAAIVEELKEVKAEMARWHRLADAAEAKYSPSQPRVPAGNPRGGQWTDRSGGQGTVATPSPDTGQGTAAGLAQPMGNVGIGDVSGSSELGGLFNIGPRDRTVDGVDLAANFNQVGSDGKLVLDVDGSPYYAPGGHHAAPWAEYSKMNFPPETRKIFDQSTSGELPKGRFLVDDSGIPKGHYWDGPRGQHGQYNAAVKELMEAFMRDRNLTPETTTPDHARDILKAIRESEDPRIRDYTRMIRTLRQIFRLRGGRE